MEKQERKNLAIMFAVGYLAYGVIYFARLNFSVAASLMESAGTLTKAQIGLIGSAFSLVYALAKVPNGYLGDRLNTKHTVAAGLAIAGVSNIVIGLAPTFTVTVLFWGLNAFGQSMLWGPLLRGFAENYTVAVSRKLSPYLTSSIGVGSVLGLLVSMALSRRLGAGVCFIVPGAACLVSAAAVLLFLKGSPGRRSADGESIFRVVAGFIKDRKFRKMIVPALGHGMVKDNVSVWMVVFFVTAYSVDISEVTAYVFFIPLCTLLGRLLYPPLLRVFGKARRLSALSYAITALSAGVLCVRGIPMWGATVCLALISTFASVLNTNFVAIFPQEYAGKDLSFAASTIDLMIYGGAAIGSAIYGRIIELTGFSGMYVIWIAVSVICIPLVLRDGKKAQ